MEINYKIIEKYSLEFDKISCKINSLREENKRTKEEYEHYIYGNSISREIDLFGERSKRLSREYDAKIATIAEKINALKIENKNAKLKYENEIRIANFNIRAANDCL